jgi:hypothetical protein
MPFVRLVRLVYAEEGRLEEGKIDGPAGEIEDMFKEIRERLRDSAPQVATVTGIVKVLYSFFQVTSCFLTAYVVPWPSNVAEFFQYSSVVKADIFVIPSIACLSRDWDRLGRLLVYTVVPPVLILLLAAPVLVARVAYAGHPKLNSQRFRDLEAGFYNALLVSVCALYPIISISVLDIYNCVRIGDASWLANDLRLACPYFEQREFLFGWTVVATLLFPVGIPALMLWCLHRFQVPRMAREKTEREALNGMIAKFQEDHKADILDARGVDCTTCALVFGILERREHMPPMLAAEDFARAMREGLASARLDYDAAQFEADCAGVFAHFDADADGRLAQQEFDALACAFRRARHDDLAPAEIRALLAHGWENRRACAPAAPQRRGQRRPSALARVFPAKPLSARDRLVRHALYLQEEEILTMGKIQWDASDAASELERTAIGCMGFLFVDYKVGYWFFELIEQLRKLLMTSVIVFFFPGSIYQLTGGILVTFVGLVLCLALKPYLRPQHTALQALCLSVQAVTLFYGVILIANNPDNTAPLAPNGVSTIVLLVNVSVVLAPLVQYFVLRRQPRGSRSAVERVAETLLGRVGRRASANPQPRSARPSLSAAVDLVSLDPPGALLSGCA